MNPARLLVLALAACLPSGCIRLIWVVHHREEPLPAAAVAALEPGAELGACLARLGAPHFVWEYQRDGMALAWAHGESSGWDLSGGYSVSDFVNVSGSFDSDQADLQGLVLWFGPDLRLLTMRTGRLRDLAPTRRQRPAPLGEDG